MIELNDAEKAAALDGRKIEAIKLLRQRFMKRNDEGYEVAGVSLYDAKQTIEAWVEAQPKDWEKLYKAQRADNERQRGAIEELYRNIDSLTEEKRSFDHDRSYDKGCLERANLDLHELRGKVSVLLDVIRIMAAKPTMHNE